jgi:epoxyqueuosine reductase
MAMKESIRELAIALGADVCGFAGIGRFKDAPAGFSPLDIFADCRTAIAFGVALPRGLSQVDPRLVYHYFNETVLNGLLDQIALKLARELERRFACRAVPVPCDDPYEYWDAERMEGRGLLSMKHAAVLAGLGTLGKNTLLLNQDFGNRLNIGAVLTDLELPSDPLKESVCIAGCTRCAERCPVGAIQAGIVVQKLCREHAYAQKTAKGYGTTVCNLCRTVCPVAFGIRN